MTRCTVGARTPWRPFSTRSTVAVDTPARRATSTIVGRRLISKGSSASSSIISHQITSDFMFDFISHMIEFPAWEVTFFIGREQDDNDTQPPHPAQGTGRGTRRRRRIFN